MNERLDDLRRELAREAQDHDAKETIKGLRWLLFSRSVPSNVMPHRSQRDSFAIPGNGVANKAPYHLRLLRKHRAFFTFAGITKRGMFVQTHICLICLSALKEELFQPL